MADTTGLDPAFSTAIQAMIAASGGKLYIVSGYRSNQEQAQLYKNAVAKYGPDNAGNWVAPPGHSNHNKGLAVDLGGDLDLAHKLAPQFGLVFPMGWEPWHIEPVGARENSNPQAYTTGPPGTTNPTADPSLAADPAFASASLASALMAGPQADMSNPAAGIAAGDVGGPATKTPSQGVASGNVGATPIGVSGNVSLEAPGTAGDKRLPGYSIQDWATAVLKGIGAPTTAQNMEALTTWANRESGGYNPSVAGGRFNPLNTTEGAVGYVGQGGSQGDIKDFGSFQQGVDAIVHNLTQTKGAGYEPVVAALKQGTDPQAVFSAVNNSAFGTKF